MSISSVPGRSSEAIDVFFRMQRWMMHR
jgi:hypothetical protein